MGKLSDKMLHQAVDVLRDLNVSESVIKDFVDSCEKPDDSVKKSCYNVDSTKGKIV